MGKPKFVSTTKMVLDLIDIGYTQTEIAKKAGVCQPSISRVKNGGDLYYCSGDKLRKFWERETSSSNAA